MVLGKLPVPGRPTIWIIVGQGPALLAVGAGGGGLNIFTLIYPFSSLSPSLWETARYSWLVGCFGFNGPLRQYFSLYRAVSQREGERGERIDESKNVQTTPTRTYCKRNRPLPSCYQNYRTPRHWKFTQHHRTIRPPPARYKLKYCLKGPLSPKQPTNQPTSCLSTAGSGRVVRWCWVNFQCRDVLKFGLQYDKGLLHLQ